jgi:ketosteroid isomerase-like protein
LTARGQQRSVSPLLLSGNERINAMTIASALLKRHFETLVDDKTQWEALIADDIVWELPFAPSLWWRKDASFAQ